MKVQLHYDDDKSKPLHLYFNLTRLLLNTYLLSQQRLPTKSLIIVQYHFPTNYLLRFNCELNYTFISYSDADSEIANEVAK